MNDTEIKPVEVIRNLGKKMRDCLKANKTSDARRLVKPWDSGFLEGKAQGFEQSAEIISRANDACNDKLRKIKTQLEESELKLAAHIDEKIYEIEQLRRENEELKDRERLAILGVNISITVDMNVSKSNCWSWIEEGTVFTMRELMECFEAENFHRMGFNLGVIHLGQSTSGEILSEEMTARLIERMKESQEMCWKLGLTVSALNFGEKERRLKRGNIKGREISAMTLELSNSVYLEMATKTFFHLPASKSHLHEAESLFGEDVDINFTDAASDIREAGNCLATGCNTASVFHSIRAVEYAVKAIWKTLGKNPPSKSNQWGNLIRDLDDEMAKKPSDRLPDFQSHVDFFCEAIAHMRAIQKAWRDPTMHVEKTYDEAQAMRIFNACKDFMGSVAAQLNQSSQWV